MAGPQPVRQGEEPQGGIETRDVSRQEMRKGRRMRRPFCLRSLPKDAVKLLKADRNKSVRRSGTFAGVANCLLLATRSGVPATFPPHIAEPRRRQGPSPSPERVPFAVALIERPREVGKIGRMVGVRGFEPPAPTSRT